MKMGHFTRSLLPTDALTTRARNYGSIPSIMVHLICKNDLPFEDMSMSISVDDTFSFLSGPSPTSIGGERCIKLLFQSPIILIQP